MATLSLGLDFGSAFVEGRFFVGGDERGPTVSSMIGPGLRF